MRLKNSLWTKLSKRWRGLGLKRMRPLQNLGQIQSSCQWYCRTYVQGSWFCVLTSLISRKIKIAFLQLLFLDLDLVVPGWNLWIWMLHRFNCTLILQNLLYLWNGFVDSLHANPLESGLAVTRHVSFLDEADWLKDICDVVESPDFSFQGFVVHLFIVSNVASGFFQRDDWLPPDKEMNELLAEVAQRLNLLVLRLSLPLLTHQTVFFVTRNLNQLVLQQPLQIQICHRIQILIHLVGLIWILRTPYIASLQGEILAVSLEQDLLQILLALLDLGFNTAGNFVDSSPLIFVFSSPADHTETFQNVDDVVNPSSFDSKFPGAAIKQQDTFPFTPVGI